MLTQDQVALVIFDVFKRHIGDSMQSFLESNKILQVYVPNNCTDLLQPMDLSMNKPFKDKQGVSLASGMLRKSARKWIPGIPVEEVYWI